MTGQIERTIEDDSVVVSLMRPEDCLEFSPDQKQFIGKSSKFSIASVRCGQYYYLQAEGKNHKKTKFYEIDILSAEYPNPYIADVSKFRIYPIDQPDYSVTVKMKFYTIINGEKTIPRFKKSERFIIKLPDGNSGDGGFNLDENGLAELETNIEKGRDTLVIDFYGKNGLHHLEPKKIPLLDYKLGENNVIDIGELEVKFDGVYVFGKLPNRGIYNYEGDITLIYQDTHFPIEKNEFVFSAQKSVQKYSVKFEADYFWDLHKAIDKSSFIVDNQKVTGIEYNLTPALYEISIFVDFIGINGNKLESIPIGIRQGSNKYILNQNGSLKKKITTTRYRTESTFYVNNKFYENHFPNFTSKEVHVNTKNYDDLSINKKIAIYEIGPKIDYTPKIRVGTEWVFNLEEGIHYGTANSHIYKGELTWKIIEKKSDGIFVLESKFDGTKEYYSGGSWWNQTNDLTGGKYLIQLADKKMTFEKINDSSGKSTIFIQSFEEELDLFQPSTYNGQYRLEEKFEPIWENDIFKPERRFKTTFSKGEGIVNYSYLLLDYDSYFSKANLISFKY